jgi:hypothetical protein
MRGRPRGDGKAKPVESESSGSELESSGPDQGSDLDDDLPSSPGPIDDRLLDELDPNAPQSEDECNDSNYDIIKAHRSLEIVARHIRRGWIPGFTDPSECVNVPRGIVAAIHETHEDVDYAANYHHVTPRVQILSIWPRYPIDDPADCLTPEQTAEVQESYKIWMTRPTVAEIAARRRAAEEEEPPKEKSTKRVRKPTNKTT